MNNVDDKKNNQKKKMVKSDYLSLFLTVSACILFYFVCLRFDSIVSVLKSILSILSPVVIGVAVAYLMDPVVEFFSRIMNPLFEKKCKDIRKAHSRSRHVAMFISMALLIIFIAALLLIIIPEVVKSISSLALVLPSQIKSFTNAAIEWVNSVEFLSENADGIYGFITDFFNNNITTAISTLIPLITNSIYSTAMFVFDFVIGLIVAIYALNEKERFVCQLKKMMFAIMKPKHISLCFDTARHGDKIFGKFLTGKILDSAIVGVICFISMSLLRMPYSLLISVVVGCTNIIPFFGPFLGAIPSAFLILLNDPKKALIFVIFILVLQQVDGNIIGPKILGNKTGVTEFWVITSILLMGGLFGFVGMIVAVPFFSVIFYLLKRMAEHFLRKKNYPIESEKYMNADTIIQGVIIDKPDIERDIASEDDASENNTSKDK